MPIIKSSRRLPEGLVGCEDLGEQVGFSHIENVGKIFQRNYGLREKDKTKGWTDDRSMQKIASIPPLMAIEAEKKYPGLFQDASMMRKFLASEEGKLCLTVKNRAI